MSKTLGQAMYDGGLVIGFAEVRRLIDAKAVTINDVPALACDQIVRTGDILKVGKHRTCVVR